MRDALLIALGTGSGLIGNLVASLISDKRTRERDQQSRLFNERKDIYSEIIFQLRAIYLSSEGYDRSSMSDEEIDRLIHKATFLTSSFSLKSRLPIVSALVKTKNLLKEDYGKEDGDALPQNIKEMEEEMRKELGIVLL